MHKLSPLTSDRISKLPCCKLHGKNCPHAEKEEGTRQIYSESVHDVVVCAVNIRVPNTEPNICPSCEILQIRVRLGYGECTTKCVKQHRSFEKIFEMIG